MIKILYKNKVAFVGGFHEIRGDGAFLSLVAIFVSLLPILFIIGNRSYVGTDYKNYLTMYNDYSAWGYKDVEVGIVWLFELTNKLKLGYKGFLWLCATLSVLFASIALCRNLDKEYASYAVLLYLFLYFGPACNIVAQIIALSFLIFAYEEIANKRWFRFLICCSFAMLFHTASIVVVPIYWIYNLSGKKRKWFIGGLAISVALAFTLFPGVIVSLLNSIGLARYAAYVNHVKIYTFFYLFVYRAPLFFVEFLYSTRLTKIDKKYNLYYILLGFEIAGMILGIGISWMGRIVYFFSIAHVILDVAIIKNAENRLNQTVYKVAFVTYYIIAFYFMHFISEFDGISVFTM